MLRTCWVRAILTEHVLVDILSILLEHVIARVCEWFWLSALLVVCEWSWQRTLLLLVSVIDLVCARCYCFTTCTTCIQTCESGFQTGIRSLSFNGDVLSIGTGAGSLFFFDLRGMEYLQMECGHPLSLNAGRGWLVSAPHVRACSQALPNYLCSQCELWELFLVLSARYSVLV